MAEREDDESDRIRFHLHEPDGDGEEPSAVDEEAVPEAGAPDEPSPPPEDPPPGYYYEEVTLADLVVTLWDHKWPALAVLALVVLGTAAFTAAQTPTYEATATLVPTHEQDVVLSVLESDRYAAHVAESLGLVDEVGGGDPQEAGRTLASSVSVATGSDRVGGSQKQILRVTATSPDAARSAAVANAYVAKSDATRSLLENVTFDRNWKQYYEEANKSEEKARQELQGLIDGYTYYRPLDNATTPASPSSPDWRLNLALGGTLGAMLAFMTPFTLEAAANVRAELRERRGGSG